MNLSPVVRLKPVRGVPKATPEVQERRFQAGGLGVGGLGCRRSQQTRRSPLDSGSSCVGVLQWSKGEILRLVLHFRCRAEGGLWGAEELFGSPARLGAFSVACGVRFLGWLVASSSDFHHFHL